MNQVFYIHFLRLNKNRLGLNAASRVYDKVFNHGLTLLLAQLFDASPWILFLVNSSGRSPALISHNQGPRIAPPKNAPEDRPAFAG